MQEMSQAGDDLIFASRYRGTILLIDFFFPSISNASAEDCSFFFKAYGLTRMWGNR